MKISEVSTSGHEIRFIHDTAIISLSIEMKGMYFDYSLDGKYKIIRVWKLFNNQWKVVAGSSIVLE